MKRRAKKDCFDRLLIHYAAMENNVSDLLKAISFGDDLNAVDSSGFTPLHFAALSGALDVATLLLEKGAFVDSQDIYGNTPLWRAVFESRGRGDLIGLLRQHGADPCLENRNGVTPLALARGIANYNVRQYFDDVSSESM